MQSRNYDGAGALAAAFDDPDTAEHVLLEGDDAEDAPAAHPARVVRELELADRARRTVTTLTLHDDGRLRLQRERRGRQGAPQQRIDLSFLDPEPVVERRFARRSGRVAVGAAVLAAGAAALASLGVAPAVTGPVAGAAALGLAGAAYAFVRLSTETAMFVTRHGRAAAIVLTATPGSFGAQRRAVPVIAAAIEQARTTRGDATHVYLKAEMREHYRLRSEGVLSATACADGTARVLTRFDTLS